MQFSIIVPVYNVESYIDRCISSLLLQSVPDFEIILVDDGSTDRSGILCDEWGKKDARIKVKHQKNQGLSGARNTGLELASGEWILFVDSDDYVSDDYLAVIEKRMRKIEADVYCFNVQRVTEDEKPDERLIFFYENDEIVIRDEKARYQFYRDTLLQYKMGWEAWVKVYNRKIIEDHALRFEPTKKVFAEDCLFTLQYFAYVRKIATICNILYCYRIRGNSLLGTKNLDTIISRFYTLSCIFDEYLEQNKMRYFKKNFSELYFYLMNYQIQYTLKTASEEQVDKWLSGLQNQENHLKWMKEIEQNQFNYRKHMVNHRWVK